MKVWQPTHPNKSAMAKFMFTVNPKFQRYEQLYQWSITHPAMFWKSLCRYFDIQFDEEPTEILEHSQDFLAARWFTGARFNFAEKLLPRRHDKLAIIALKESGEREVLSYQTLWDKVSRCATGLKALNIGVGDRVAAVMPNCAESIIAMLATTSLGAIWSSCSPDFGTSAIIDRFGQIEPKVIFISDGHQYNGKMFSNHEKMNDITTAIPSCEKIVIFPFMNLGSVDNYSTIHTRGVESELNCQHTLWNDFLAESSPLTFVSLPFDHPVYILFSSGTTGKPKCIVHGAGGTLLQHVKELGLHTNLTADDNLCFYTTCGWMMWNWMVSALALGATITLPEGSPVFPDFERLFRIIEQEKVSVFGTNAKYLLSIEKSNTCPKDSFKMQHLHTILSTGSPLLPQNYDFVYQHIKSTVQLSSISGGTDIISCFALGNPLLPVFRGEIQCIGLGMSVDIFDEEGIPTDDKGELVCTAPFPSMPICFWNDPENVKYQAAYFSRFQNTWAHGDFARLTPHHGLIIYGRSDAVLNPGGVRIGTAEIYRQVEKIPEVVDSVVIGQNWEQDVRVVLFVKLQEGTLLDEKLIQTIKQTIRIHASPKHVPAVILQVPDIPRTMSGKIVELAVRQVVNGEPVQNIASIANPQALDFFKGRLDSTDH